MPRRDGARKTQGLSQMASSVVDATVETAQSTLEIASDVVDGTVETLGSAGEIF